jgi:hypothetical protein
VDYFVGVFGIDVVFDCLGAAFFKVLWRDLDQVCDCDLFFVSFVRGEYVE